ncbi:T9SS-dependent choice-of-anchor J family protein [Winogradskyella helgolandensis]|uniref:T9SS-dependent choice-of-anchor J family protein n=1 Tax=Winogradskyella helgolandensis TaxID=2697010 RepID=UPI0015CE7748|nr:choice-of-anchor J domain-containing protein [Winogradskyella helgolandensis]
MKKITLMLFALVAVCWQSNAQFAESFDTEIPATWTVLNEDTGSNTWVHVTSYPQAGAGHARIQWESVAHQDYLITPQFTVTSGTSDRVSFYAGTDGIYFTETFEVKVSTTGTAAADFTDLIASETAETSAADGDYTYYEYDLSAYNGSDIYVAIVATDTDRYYLAVDEFVNDALPSCLKPISLSASVVNATEAELSWTESGASTVWDIEIVDVTASETVTGVATATSVSNPYTAMGLTEGNDYEFYVRTDCGTDGISAWAGPFAWSQNVPPANDECGAAIALTVNEDLDCAAVTSGTVLAATDSGVDTCGGTEDDDVWYSFVATADKHRVSLINIAGSTTDMYHAVYDATVGCGALEDAIRCNDGNTSNLTDLVIGNTYLVQVYTWTSNPGQTSTFDICVGTPCLAEAGTLTADEASVVLAGTATISATANGDMFVPTDYEVTYVLTSGASLLIEQTSATPSFVVDAIGDYTIHTLVAETSDDMDSNYVDLSVIELGVTTGADVLALFSSGDICADLDAVGASISVNDGSEMDFNNVQWVTDGTTGSDVSLTVGVTTPITVFAKGYEAGVTDAEGQGAGVECWIAINDENTDPSTWDNALWQVATFEGDAGTSDDQYEYTTSTTPVGTNYVAARWRLNNAGFTYAGYNGTWDGTTNISVELVVEPIANDDCAGAQVLTVENEIADLASATQVAGSIAAATDSGVSACAGNANDDVWFSFVATSTDINIDVTDDFDGVVEVFSGACGSLVAIECDDYDGPSYNPSISRTDFVVGETYFLRVHNYYAAVSTAPDFTIALWSSEEVLGINDFETEAAFSYYPNPVKNTLSLNAQNTIEQVAMYNMLGQEVLRVIPNTVDSDLDMSHLQTGTYFVKVTIANVTKTIRVIKQ